MPGKSLKPCNKIGCKNLTRERYCEQHVREVSLTYERQRGSAHARGYDKRWKKYRLEFLANNPICEACHNNGLLRAAVIVDHIQPHKGNQTIFWDPTNHQALCISCHSAKTVREDGGFGHALLPKN